MAKKKIIIIYLKNGGNTQRSSCLWIVLSPGALLEVAPTVHVCTVGAAPPCRGQATLHLALPSQQHLNNRHSWAKPSSMQVQNNVPACGSLRAYAGTHSSCLVCVKEREAGTCSFCKTDSRFCMCEFSNPLMFAPLGYHRVKFQKGALN